MCPHSLKCFKGTLAILLLFAGAAAMAAAPGQRHEDLIETADLALYRAKAEGKNRVCAGGVRSEAGGERTSPAA